MLKQTSGRSVWSIVLSKFELRFNAPLFVKIYCKKARVYSKCMFLTLTGGISVSEIKKQKRWRRWIFF